MTAWQAIASTPASLTPENDNCSSVTTDLNLLSARFIIPVIALAAFNLIVIIGNSLVVLAVFTTRKLRTVTNMFIVSLACADLLIGIFVLPYASAHDLLQYWMFGPFICSVWLAVDVWASTASILNLCAISFDRYLAISYPFRYPALMMPRRGRLLIAAVWVFSFVICFPPLIGWKESGSFGDNDTQSASTNCTQALPAHCALTSEPGYVIYSALGSFWIPMCVMVFFYWRIYRTAVRTTSALKRGVITTKGPNQPSSMSSTPDQQALTLRVHRGGTLKKVDTARSVTDISGATRLKELRQTQHAHNKHNNSNSRTHPYAKVHIKFGRRSASSGDFMLLPDNNTTSVDEPANTSPEVGADTARTSVEAYANGSPSRKECAPLTRAESSNSILRRTNTTTARTTGKINCIKLQLKRMNKEKKAAKTVGIIVGCFICCWLPFFTAYLLGAFCSTCTSGVFFTVFIWLGYFNSAMNPFVYALFSRDFRYAFTKLLRCRCRRQRVPPLNNRFLALLSSIRFQVSSNKNSDSTSE